MTDNRLIDVYNVTTGRLVERLTQDEALKRILVHCCTKPDAYNMEHKRYVLDDLLKGSTERYSNLFYCCTEAEPERVPTLPVLETEKGCPACMGTGYGTGFNLAGLRKICDACCGTGNSD